MPADQNRAELVRQAHLLKQEIDAALADIRARAQAAKAAKGGKPCDLSPVSCGGKRLETYLDWSGGWRSGW